MANPFPFVAGDILTAAELNGIGEVTTYTPTLTNLTLGNGTMSANYVRVQNYVWGQIKLNFGSTTVMGSTPTFSLPVTGATVLGDITSHVYLLDSGVAFYLASALTSTTAITPIAVNTAGTYLTNSSNFTATVPFTWATNDFISISFSYRTA
jgi:hypothetical protein